MGRLLAGVAAVSLASALITAGCGSCGESKPQDEPTAEAPSASDSGATRRLFRLHWDGGRRHMKIGVEAGADAPVAPEHDRTPPP